MQKRLGLIHKVVPVDELENVTYETAKNLASKAPTAIKLEKEWQRELRNRVFGMSIEEVMKKVVEYHRRAYASGEPQKIMKAFLEKRKRKNRKR